MVKVSKDVQNVPSDQGMGWQGVHKGKGDIGS